MVGAVRAEKGTFSPLAFNGWRSAQEWARTLNFWGGGILWQGGRSSYGGASVPYLLLEPTDEEDYNVECLLRFYETVTLLSLSHLHLDLQFAI